MRAWFGRLLCKIGCHDWKMTELVGFYRVGRKCQRCSIEDVLDVFGRY